MEEDIFVNCGSYSEKLSKMANKIIQERKLSGEKITKKDVDEVENNVYKAYQMILTNVSAYGVDNLDIVISNSVNLLDDIITTRGDISGIVSTADDISKKEIIKDMENIQKEEKTGAGIVIAGTGAYLASDAINELITNKLFNSKLIQEINTLYGYAESGNVSDVANINETENLVKFMTTHSQIDSKSSRALYTFMMRAAVLDNQTVNEVIEQAADYYGIDIFSIDNEGNREIDLLKIQKGYQDSVKDVNPVAATKTVEDFRKLSSVAAEKKVKQKAYVGDEVKDITSFEQAYIEQRSYTNFMKKINEKYRMGDFSGMEDLFRTNPEYATRATKEVLSWQQMQSRPMRKAQLERQGITMGEMLQSQKKQTSNLNIEDITKGVNMFESKEQDGQEDDYVI